MGVLVIMVRCFAVYLATSLSSVWIFSFPLSMERVILSLSALFFMNLARSFFCLSGILSIMVRMSPIWTPAFPAGEVLSMSMIFSPLGASSTAIPMNAAPFLGLVANGPLPMNSPFFILSQYLWKTYIGTCMFISVTTPTRLWIPMSIPFMSNNGPPESPPMRLQSLWNVLVSILPSLPSLSPLPLFLLNPPEWPSENTQSPSLVLAFFSSFSGSMWTNGYLPLSVIWSMAASLSELSPRLIALCFVPSSMMTVSSMLTPAVTWAALRTRPSSEMMTPLPEAEPCWIPTVAALALSLFFCRSFWMARRSLASGTFLSLKYGRSAVV